MMIKSCLTPKRHILLRAQSLLFLWAWVACALAGMADNRWIQEAQEEITRTGTAIEAFDPQSGNAEDLDTLLRPLFEIRLEAQKCIDTRNESIERLKKNLDLPGEGGAAAPAADSGSSQELRNRLAAEEEQLAVCRTLLVDSRSLADRLHALQNDILKTYLLSRGPNLWDVSIANLQQANTLYPLVRSFLLERLQLNRMQRQHWLVTGILLVSAFVLGIWGRRWLRQRLAAVQVEGFTVAMLTSLMSCLAAALPMLFTIVTACGWFMFALPMAPLPPSVVVLLGLLVYVAGSVLVRTFLRPCRPARHFLAAKPGYCRALGKHLHVLLMLLVIAVLVYGMGIQNILSTVQWHLARGVFLTLAVVNLLWLIMDMRSAPAPFSSRKLRGLLVLALLASLAAEYLGFRNLSAHLLTGLLGTTLLGSILWVTHVLLQEFFDGLNEGRYQWERKLRHGLSLGEGEPVPGVIWLRLLTILTIWFLFAAGTLALWGYGQSIRDMLSEGLVSGYQVAGMQIVPLNLIIAVAVFALLVTVVRWMRNEALPAWVSRMEISHGAKEATVTISGYVGIILAALVGLSLAGFNFTNLAIVVGALSVGIGFGLQNIVNNFISGLILLFERPVRTGDWVVVGSTEGYVRRISIRSTQIETFDRADVIVPNSELISNQVTNWMLNDPWGRVIVPIGVAYGTDVELLRDLLLKVAGEHPLVIKDGSKVSPPKVLFRGFGDSSLDFELRCFIRLVDRRLDTLSELNFAIERTLREAGIQIPFPQRDLHLRSADPSFDFVRRPDE
jgi:potassium efflux system protein